MLAPPTPPPMMTTRAGREAVAAGLLSRWDHAGWREPRTLDCRGCRSPQIPASVRARLDEVLDELPSTAGRSRTVEPLEGGLTNFNFKVVTRTSGPWSCGCPASTSDLLSIDRAAEHTNSRHAATAGAAPAVVDYLPGRGRAGGGVGRGAHVRARRPARRRATSARSPTACRLLHAAPRFTGDFDMLRIQRRYLRHRAPSGASGCRTATSSSCRPSTGSRRRWRCGTRARCPATTTCSPPTSSTTASGSGSSTTSTPATTTPASSWATSGASRPSTPSTSPSWSTPTTASTCDAKIARARLLGLMSKYGWTLWASIQSAVSPIEFDFWSWGMEKYERAVTEFDDPGFGDLLDRAAAPAEPDRLTAPARVSRGETSRLSGVGATRRTP